MLSEYEKFLYEFYKGEITNLLNDHFDSNHASIVVDLNNLKSKNSKLYSEIVNNIQKIECEWSVALLNIQNKIAKEDCFLDSDYTIKENCHVRFANLPSNEDMLSGSFPDNECIGLFVQVKGNVVQMAKEKLLEIKREMVCSKCNSTFIFEAQYGKMYKFDIPQYCLNVGNCRGILRVKNNLPKPGFCMYFQQIKIQEFATMGNGKYPKSLTICLENDLVNSCKPGECLTICGTVEVRWRCLNTGSQDLHVLSLRANSIVKDNRRPNVTKDFDEQMFCAQAQWQENVDNLGHINARNLVVNSLCPEIIGMRYIKLGLVLALCSGFSTKRKKLNDKRDQSHVLLVGDSGTGKSKLLKAVCEISVGAIHTNGLGCSVAGLTAAAVKDGGDWSLQAGALVLADGGLCCIDQFNLMHQHDKAAVHETMEQQTVSIAKAGLVCKLQTQCVILASANFKSLFKPNVTERFTSSNLDIGTPLLSRFDLIFAVNDEREIEWDLQITDHLLQLTKNVNIYGNLKPLDQQRLQSHFVAVREINPKFSEIAHILLGSYYKYYRSNFQRDLSRTTVRMLDSLNRLAQSHARLMFRNEVLAFDAMIVIELLETTWGFGKIIKPSDLVKNEMELLIDDKIIIAILKALSLLAFKTQIFEEKQYFFNKKNNHIPSNFQQNTNIENAQNQGNELEGTTYSKINAHNQHIKKVQISDFTNHRIMKTKQNENNLEQSRILLNNFESKSNDLDVERRNSTRSQSVANTKTHISHNLNPKQIKKSFVDNGTTKKSFLDSNLKCLPKSFDFLNADEISPIFLLENLDEEINKNNHNGNKSHINDNISNKISKSFWNFPKNANFNSSNMTDNISEERDARTRVIKKPFVCDGAKDARLNFNSDFSSISKNIKRTNECASISETNGVSSKKIQKTENSRQKSLVGFMKSLSETDNLDFLKFDF